MDAAALPLAALTAWQALADHAGLTAGETVLVHGAAGGVGVYAVQRAAGLGAHVIATDIGAHAGFVKQLGAERFIDVVVEDIDDGQSGLDVVLDTVGGTTLERSYGVLRRSGRLVTLGAPPPPTLAEERGVHAMFFVVQPDCAELARLATLVDAGQRQPVVSQTFALADVEPPTTAAADRDRPAKPCSASHDDPGGWAGLSDCVGPMGARGHHRPSSAVRVPDGQP